MSKIYVRSQTVDNETVALNGIKIQGEENIFESLMFNDSHPNPFNISITDDYSYLVRDLRKVSLTVSEIIAANDKINPIVASRNKNRIRQMERELRNLVSINNRMLEIVKYWNFLSERYSDEKDSIDIILSNIGKIEKKMLLNHTEMVSNYVLNNKLEYYKGENEVKKSNLLRVENSFSDKIKSVCINIEEFNSSLMKLNEHHKALIKTYQREIRSTIHTNKTKIAQFENPTDYILKKEINESIAILGYIDSGNEDDKNFWLEISQSLYDESVISNEDYKSLNDRIRKSSFQFAHILLQKLMNYGFEKVAYYKDIKDFFNDKDSYKVVSTY